MNRHSIRLALAAVVIVGALVASEAHAFRMIQNTGVGRFSSGYLVTCNDPGGFVHWNNANIVWHHNTSGQGSGKQTAIQNALASWTNVSPAAHNLTYGGTTTKGWATDGTNTMLWAKGNGCSGTCLALTALVLASGQVITETDITYNSRYTWNTNGSAYDTEAVAAHEVGHALGLHHTEITGTPRPTMYASYFGTDGRTLENDDKDGLNCAHNRYPPSTQQMIAREATPGVRNGSTHLLAARPWAGGARLRYAVQEPGQVTLDVFDVAGRKLATLVDGAMQTGEHEIAWDGTTVGGRVSAGVYFARLVTPSGSAKATVVLAQ